MPEYVKKKNSTCLNMYKKRMFCKKKSRLGLGVNMEPGRFSLQVSPLIAQITATRF